KAKVARSECEMDGASDLEALFASGEEAKPPNILATVARFHQKAKVARSECEMDGASDLEALFASREEVKPPNILATVAGFH
ncbi:hypothetical protein ACUN2O_27350, partial [Bacillus cereus group sp. BceL246]